jgi:hypothetical protein
VKNEYGAALKHMKSELCSEEDEDNAEEVIKAVIRPEGGTSAQVGKQQSTTGPSTADTDEEVKVDEKE